MGTKTIKKITCRSGLYLDAISIQFTDGSSTPWHGGDGGVEQSFELVDGQCAFPLESTSLICGLLGEDITQALVYSTDSLITKIKFITSKGEAARHGPRRGLIACLQDVSPSTSEPRGIFPMYGNAVARLWRDLRGPMARP